MSTKRKIVVMSVILLIGLLVLSSSLVFSVRKINVSLAQGTTFAQLEAEEKEILSGSGIRKNRSIFFVNTRRAVRNIEKNVPYARVEHITRSFPDRITISLSLRTGLFYFRHEHGYDRDYLLLDRNLKVLERRNAQIVSQFLTNPDSTQNIQLINVPAGPLTPGQFMKVSLVYNFVNELMVPRQPGGGVPFVYDLRADIKSIARSGNDLILVTRDFESVITIQNATVNVIGLGNAFITYMMMHYHAYTEKRAIRFHNTGGVWQFESHTYQ